MQGKTVVATGATSGIGEIAVVELARMGARVVFIARDAKRAEATLAKLEAVAPGRGHSAHIADLSLIAETRRVGGEIAAGEARIDVLINNAGAIFSDRRVTAEGLEMTFAFNHMAYFMLTEALARAARRPRRRRASSRPPRRRIAGAKLDFDDLQCARGYSGMAAYSRSKLANILFTRELARRLAGTGVTANCLHPGFVASRFGDEAGGWTARLFPFVKRFAISPSEGADTIVYLASSPDAAAASGEYFAKRKSPEALTRGARRRAAARLWEKSEAIAA